MVGHIRALACPQRAPAVLRQGGPLDASRACMLKNQAAFCPPKTGVWDPNVLRPTCASPTCAVPSRHTLPSARSHLVWTPKATRVSPTGLHEMAAGGSFSRTPLASWSSAPCVGHLQSCTGLRAGTEHQLPTSSPAPARSFLTSFKRTMGLHISHTLMAGRVPLLGVSTLSIGFLSLSACC